MTLELPVPYSRMIIFDYHYCVVRQKNLGEAEAAPFFSLEFTKTLNYEPKYKLFRTAHFFPSHQFVQTQSSFCHYSADKG
jgi:hypothetical protein